ncbi:hypothetical protein [Ruminococcus flavefaciens]|uniref:hypothetical protein n=1 Tax=Ruminococcus flavefaciens TaxID=1265 RepID=UPI0013DC3D42|nr:hypothetical protein [Ruminococcus flavefaciens]
MKALVFISALFLIGTLLFVVLYQSGIVKRIKTSIEYVTNPLDIEQELFLQYINDDKDCNLKYEQLKNEEYIPNKFSNFSDDLENSNGKKLLMGRGSWRATQGNIYSYNMFEKDLKNEFSKRL